MKNALKLVALFPLALTALTLYKIIHPDVLPTQYSVPWMEALGINFSLHLDGLSLLMALLISGIGFLIFIYAATYLKGHVQAGRFFFILSLFMISMLGIVFSGNVLLLFVFWELTGITSYFLIGFNHENNESRVNALQALLVTGAGGLCLLASFIFMGQIAGSYEISNIFHAKEVILHHPQSSLILTLLLLGAFTKSAQFPFHFWLPNAMSAPTPVSAYLHSSTMVKAGVYLLIRFFPLFGATTQWQNSLVIIGTLTILTGVWTSLSGKEDMKKQLAYMTITALGVLVLMIGIGTPFALHACLIFLLAHAMYKAALFMLVGAVDHEVHSRNAFLLGGLRRIMPLTAIAAVLAALSMAGFPPFFGFVAKEMMLEASLKSTLNFIGSIGLSLAGVAFVVYAGVITIKTFFGRPSNLSQKGKEPGLELWLCPMVLAVGGLLLSFFPQYADGLIKPAALSVLPDEYFAKIKMWHGVNHAFIWSMMLLVIGFVVYLFFERLTRFYHCFSFLKQLAPQRVYFGLLKSMLKVSGVQTDFLQNGYLRNYLKATILVMTILCGLALFKAGFMLPEAGDFGWLETVLCLLVIVAAVASVILRDRLSSVACIGVVGLGAALLFVIFSAPDLAMTQFTVDMLSVILLALVLCKMPSRSERGSKYRWLDILISSAAGFVMFIFSLFILSNNRTELPDTAFYFVANSLDKAYGGNVVNTILVDFRAMDTLGEVTVLAVAGLGAFALLKLGLKKGEEKL